VDTSRRNRSAKDLLRDLREDGWIEEYQQGGHKQLSHPTKPGKITIPWHRNGSAVLHPKIVKSVYKAAGLLNE
jgi:predicted RNA binding protein YcfA (HicA-like mRNA interferase family)